MVDITPCRSPIEVRGPQISWLLELVDGYIVAKGEFFDSAMSIRDFLQDEQPLDLTEIPDNVKASAIQVLRSFIKICRCGEDAVKADAMCTLLM